MSQESDRLLNELMDQIEKDDDLLRSFVERWDRNVAKFQTLIKKPSDVSKPAIDRVNSCPTGISIIPNPSLPTSRTLFHLPNYIININIPDSGSTRSIYHDCSDSTTPEYPTCAQKPRLKVYEEEQEAESDSETHSITPIATQNSTSKGFINSQAESGSSRSQSSSNASQVASELSRSQSSNASQNSVSTNFINSQAVSGSSKSQSSSIASSNGSNAGKGKGKNSKWSGGHIPHPNEEFY
jgi:hypothetical protein